MHRCVCVTLHSSNDKIRPQKISSFGNTKSHNLKSDDHGGCSTQWYLCLVKESLHQKLLYGKAVMCIYLQGQRFYCLWMWQIFHNLKVEEHFTESLFLMIILLSGRFWQLIPNDCDTWQLKHAQNINPLICLSELNKQTSLLAAMYILRTDRSRGKSNLS